MNDRKFIKGLREYWRMIEELVLSGRKSYQDLTQRERMKLSLELFSTLDGLELILRNADSCSLEDAIIKYMKPCPNDEDKKMLGGAVMLIVLEATYDMIDEDIFDEYEQTKVSDLN